MVASAVLSVARLPARATLQALRSAANPSAINALSMAIAQASLRVVKEDEDVEIDGLQIDIELNEDRLLSTAGFATALSIGSLYWIGNRLNIQVRYANMISALDDLRIALDAGDELEAARITRRIDALSNPLLDPETLLPIEASDEVRDVFEILFDRPAINGSMFQAENLVSLVDEAIEAGSRVSTLAAKEATGEALEAMILKARPIAGFATSRLVGAALWVDTVFWVATSAIDLGLNYAGIPEEDQRIPILADIPFIGALFDLSDSVGSSFVDLVIAPILDGIISLLGFEDEAEALISTLWGIITSAALNPTLLPFVIALLDFYIEDLDLEFEVPALFNISTIEGFTLDPFKVFRPEPIDILILWLYAIVGKILFKAWLIPALEAIKRG